MTLKFKYERYLMRYIAPVKFYTYQIFLYAVYTVCICIKYIGFYINNDTVFFMNDLLCISVLIVMFTVLNPYKAPVYARTVEVVDKKEKSNTLSHQDVIKTSDGSEFFVKAGEVSQGDTLILTMPYDDSNDEVRTFDIERLYSGLTVYVCSDDGSMKKIMVED